MVKSAEPPGGIVLMGFDGACSSTGLLLPIKKIMIAIKITPVIMKNTDLLVPVSVWFMRLYIVRVCGAGFNLFLQANP